MPKEKTARRGQPLFLLVGTVVALLLASLPVAVPAFAEYQHNQLVNSLQYKQTHGFWEILDLPEEFRINSIHAAMLPTGKVLLVAGSGNNRDAFNAFHDKGTIAVLKTVVLDPVTGTAKTVDTPDDLFCSGHTFLQSGKLLVAGGTSGYELLGSAVKKPAGTIVLHNEDPNSSTRTFKKGTEFIGENGKAYLSTKETVLEPATKMDHGNGDAMVTHSSAKVFVEAVSEDPSYVTSKDQKFIVDGLEGSDTQNIYAQGGPMTLKKQDYRGDNKSFEFDPISEKYVAVGDLHESRWYPSLPVLQNGHVLAVSGLDAGGNITETTEQYDPATTKWTPGPSRAFPTYPAMFRTGNPDILFYSGSSAGYGPQDKGRQPGFWNVATNDFQPVTGLRNPDITETSASVMLPPKKGSNDGSQSTKLMLAGGGGVGESPLITKRTDIIDLAAQTPVYTPGSDLTSPLRYVNMTIMPSDELFTSGGTGDYRGKGNSYSLKASMIDPNAGTTTAMADELVGRGYHSGSLLLPDGRVLVFGNDPLYADKDNTKVGKFDQRIEIFTPPQLFKGQRPVLAGATTLQANRGQQLDFASTGTIKTARLIPPGSSTHVTTIEQRSIAAVVKSEAGSTSITLPADETVLNNGWYMLFVTDQNGVPSVAKMVQITN